MLTLTSTSNIVATSIQLHNSIVLHLRVDHCIDVLNVYLPSVIWLWIPGPYFPSHLLCIQDMIKWKPSNSWMMNIVLYVFICQLHFQSMWTVSFQVQVCPELLCIRYTSCDERKTFQLQYNSMYVQLCVYPICVSYM